MKKLKVPVDRTDSKGKKKKKKHKHTSNKRFDPYMGFFSTDGSKAPIPPSGGGAHHSHRKNSAAGQHKHHQHPKTSKSNPSSPRIVPASASPPPAQPHPRYRSSTCDYGTGGASLDLELEQRCSHFRRDFMFLFKELAPIVGIDDHLSLAAIQADDITKKFVLLLSEGKSEVQKYFDCIDEMDLALVGPNKPVVQLLVDHAISSTNIGSYPKGEDMTLAVCREATLLVKEYTSLAVMDHHTTKIMAWWLPQFLELLAQKQLCTSIPQTLLVNDCAAWFIQATAVTLYILCGLHLRAFLCGSSKGSSTSFEPLQTETLATLHEYTDSLSALYDQGFKLLAEVKSEQTSRIRHGHESRQKMVAELIRFNFYKRFVLEPKLAHTTWEKTVRYGPAISAVLARLVDMTGLEELGVVPTDLDPSTRGRVAPSPYSRSPPVSPFGSREFEPVFKAPRPRGNSFVLKKGGLIRMESVSKNMRYKGQGQTRVTQLLKTFLRIQLFLEWLRPKLRLLDPCAHTRNVTILSMLSSVLSLCNDPLYFQCPELVILWLQYRDLLSKVINFYGSFGGETDLAHVANFEDLFDGLLVATRHTICCVIDLQLASNCVIPPEVMPDFQAL